MIEEIHRITIADEFKICPLCGYKDGFHSAFKKNRTPPSGSLSVHPVKLFLMLAIQCETL